MPRGGCSALYGKNTPNLKEISSLTDHILTNTNEKIARCGVINVGLSENQTIF